MRVVHWSRRLLVRSWAHIAMRCSPRARPAHLIRKLLINSIILLVVAGAWAQSNEPVPGTLDKVGPLYVDGEPVYKVGGAVIAPRPVYTPEAKYSEQARKAELQGTCMLWIVVGADGKPHDVRISHSLGMGLDEKSIEAVRTWRFKPAVADDQPVAVQINVETSFRMSGVGTPATLDPLPTNSAQSRQLPGTDPARYPLTIDVRLVSGRHTKEGYVVNAEATINEGGQGRKAIISCGPREKCFMLGWGKYTARWLSSDAIELLGCRDGKGKWQKVHFSIMPLQPVRD